MRRKDKKKEERTGGRKERIKVRKEERKERKGWKRRQGGKMKGRKESGPKWTPLRAGSGPRAACLTPLL